MQMRGKKQVILIDPHSNHQLYEGHIQEATMSYNFSSHSFERKHLLDETVYVWTPFDISNPDYSVSLSLFILTIRSCVISILRMCEMIISCLGYSQS